MADEQPDRSLPIHLPIPAEFHSLADGAFTACMLCETNLLGSNIRYVVERIFRGTEPIIEYAMCVECQQCVSAEMSEESRNNIKAFYSELDWHGRLQTLLEQFDGESIEPWIDHCLVSGKPKAECSGYQLVGVFTGPLIEVSVAPLMISTDGMQQIAKLLSKGTRDRLDDFVGDNFGMPPEFCEQPDFFPGIV